MHWLPHCILLTGTTMAATMGFALAALVLRNALGKSLKSDSQAKNANDFSSEKSTEWPLPAVRGYDMPELWREDTLARGEHTDENYFH